MDKPKEINADISILATYEHGIMIRIKDIDAGISFIDITMTKEQFVDATMNRLGNTKVLKAEVRDLDKVGKQCKARTLEFPMPEGSAYRDKEAAAREAIMRCPLGWEAELYFGSQDSFFKRDGAEWARTTIRMWWRNP